MTIVARAMWRRWPVPVRDVLFAVLPTGLLLLLTVIDVPFLGPAALPRAVWPDSVLFAAGICAPLALRWRLPLAGALVSGAVLSLSTVADDVTSYLGNPVTLVAFGYAGYRHRHRPLPVLLCGAVYQVADMFVMDAPLQPSSLLPHLLVGLAPIAIGIALRAQRDRAGHEIELQRAEASRRAADERARISQDVHDLVGHHLCAIRMQAVGARHADPAAHPALGTIAELSTEALTEIRQLLDLLDGDAPGPVYARLSDVDTLARRMSGQGVRVRVTLRHPDTLPPLVEHCAYRIIQEALTNAVRHSRAGRIEVRAGADGGALTVEVDDDGPGTVPAGAAGHAVHAGTVRPEGNGIRGMRERAGLVGGMLTAGPRSPHGWRVRAVLPCAVGSVSS